MVKLNMKVLFIYLFTYWQTKVQQRTGFEMHLNLEKKFS